MRENISAKQYKIIWILIRVYPEIKFRENPELFSCINIPLQRTIQKISLSSVELRKMHP
jgi:hypothetical protein